MERKTENKTQEAKSSLSLENRKKLVISGVIEVLGFDDEVIELNTKLGALTVKGEGLKMDKLDVENGDVIINGSITSMVYSKSAAKKGAKNLLGKLFK